jgi:two-component system sensor histidine kinase HydH
MPLRTYPGRLLLAAAVSSALVLVVTGTVAGYLLSEQARTVESLSEDIGSRGAAINIEATVNNLIALHQGGQGGSRDVGPLLAQMEADVTEINRYADKEDEIVLAKRVTGKFVKYLDLARAAPPGPTGAGELADFLRREMLPAIQALRRYNGERLVESEREHRQALNRMAWGTLAVGGLGSVAGLVFGFGLARSLRRTIHQFLVRVQGASELLGPEAPTVEWERVGEPLRDGGEDLLRKVGQVVQRLQQREREVRRAERLAALGQLAAGLAHEVRNPLTSALLLLETGRKDPAAGGLTPEDLELIEQELHRIERSVQEFIDFARPPKLERAPCDLAAVAREAVALVRGRADLQTVAVRLTVPDRPLVLPADRDQVRQVLLNLVLNALDVMPNGGELAVAVTPGPAGAVELAVADTGPGISAAMQPRLFEPFATGKETGLGLGLVVSKRIVEEHGGTIVGENQPGGGAQFTVRLPGPEEKEGAGTAA